MSTSISRSLLVYALPAACAYLLGLIYYLPASLLQSHLPAEAAIGALEGTVLDGRARGVALGPVEWTEVRWSLRPLALFWGELSADVATAGGLSLNGVLSRSLFGDRWQLEDARVTADLRSLPTSLLSPLQLGGQLTLDLDNGEYRSGERLGLVGRLRWQPAAFGIGETIALGEISGELSDTGDEALLRLSSRGGEVALNGELGLKPDMAYRVQLNVQAPPGLPAATRRQLALLGVGNPGGGEIRQNGVLPGF